MTILMRVFITEYIVLITEIIALCKGIKNKSQDLIISNHFLFRLSIRN